MNFFQILELNDEQEKLKIEENYKKKFFFPVKMTGVLYRKSHLMVSNIFFCQNFQNFPKRII